MVVLRCSVIHPLVIGRDWVGKEIGEIGGERRKGLGLVELGEEGIDPRGEIGGVVEDGVGEVVGGKVEHGGFEAFEALSHLPELRRTDLVASAGKEAIYIRKFSN